MARVDARVRGRDGCPDMADSDADRPPGYRSSFIAALHLGAARGFDVGSEIVSTYGPLGFLSFPQPYMGWTSGVATAFVALVHIAICAALIARSRRLFPLWVALGLAYVGALTVAWLGVPEAVLALSFLLSVEAIERAAAGRYMTVPVASISGAAAAVAWLGKLNTGAVVLAVAVITIWIASRPRRAPLIAFSSILLLSSAALWLASGQGVDNVIPFLESGVAIIAGYNAAMGLDQDLTVHWMFGAVAILVGVLAAAGTWSSQGWGHRYRIGVLVVGALVAFITLKGAFVRWHYMFAFATAIIAIFAFMAPNQNRTRIVLSFAVALTAFAAAGKIEPLDLVKPRVEAALHQMGTLVSQEDRRAEYDSTRSSMAAGYGLGPALLSQLADRPTHIGPLESGVAFAYPQINWRPLPVFQDYSVYTYTLDALNRAFLLSDRAPERLLRSTPVAIDDRNPWYEGPAMTLAVLCRYSELVATDRWQVLGRVEDRCGTPSTLEVVQARAGATIPVPKATQPGQIVVARIDGLDPALSERVFSFLFKAPEWYVVLDGERRYRLIADTAQDGLLMAVPDTLHFSMPFSFGESVSLLQIEQGKDGLDSSTPLQIEFVAIDLAAP